MSELKNKLAQLNEKREKIELELKAAISERKVRIGALADRCKILEMSDEFFCGLFLDAVKKIGDSNYVSSFENSGSTFLNKKRGEKKKAAK